MYEEVWLYNTRTSVLYILTNCRSEHFGGKSRWCSFACHGCLAAIWGRILGQNPPCYTQPPLQLCLEISISSNSRNLLQFLLLQCGYCTVKKRGGKPDRKPHPLPYGVRNPETSSLRTLKSVPRNLKEIAHSWIRLLESYKLTGYTPSIFWAGNIPGCCESSADWIQIWI